MNPAFRQIGNVVPPLMARAIAVTMMKAVACGQEETANEPCRQTAAV